MEDVWISYGPTTCDSNSYNSTYSYSCVSCSLPLSGYYVSSICTSTSDTVISQCTLIIPNGYYVSSLCSTGSSSSLGSNFVISPCSTSAPKGYYINSSCFSGNSTTFGNDIKFLLLGSSWTRLTSSASWLGRSYFPAVVLNNKIVIIGGKN